MDIFNQSTYICERNTCTIKMHLRQNINNIFFDTLSLCTWNNCFNLEVFIYIFPIPKQNVDRGTEYSYKL